MADKSLLLLIPILTIAIFLSLSISYANATVVNHTDFSIQVPDGWVYRENFPIENSIVSTPSEFANLIGEDPSSTVLALPYAGIVVEIAPDPDFLIKNAPVETYFKQKHPSYSYIPNENATLGGERAIKVLMNGTYLASIGGPSYFRDRVATEYLVMHDDQPYYLNYGGYAKDYQKYLPQFEQIVKTFKFTK